MTKFWLAIVATLALLVTVYEAGAAQMRSFGRPAMSRPVSNSMTGRQMGRSERTMSRRTTRTTATSRRDRTTRTGRKDDSIRGERGGSSTHGPGNAASDVNRGDGRKGGAVTSSTVAREKGQAVKFDRKPTDVAHNPERHDGNLGQGSDHKSVLVEKDGHYFKRSYYSGLAGGVLTWYWYETALADSDPVIPKIPYVATCKEETDDCQVTTRTPPIGITWQDVVDYWNGPLKVTPRCDEVYKISRAKGGGRQAVITCASNSTAPCSGSCQLSDYQGTSLGASPPASTTESFPPGALTATCKCP